MQLPRLPAAGSGPDALGLGPGTKAQLLSSGDPPPAPRSMEDPTLPPALCGLCHLGSPRLLREEPCPSPTKLGEAPGNPHSPCSPPTPHTPVSGGGTFTRRSFLPRQLASPQGGYSILRNRHPPAHRPAAARSPALQINTTSYQPCPCLRAPAQGGPRSGGPLPPPPRSRGPRGYLQG